jgi:hypothetical protein
MKCFDRCRGQVCSENSVVDCPTIRRGRVPGCMQQWAARSRKPQRACAGPMCGARLLLIVRTCPDPICADIVAKLRRRRIKLRQFGIAIMLFVGFCYSHQSGDFQSSSTHVWGSTYHRVDSAGRVQIRARDPKAAKIKVNF